jgi:hypothetical protein
MKLTQHVMALLAAILLGVASIFQARRALAKAEHERIILPDEKLRESLTMKFKPRELRRQLIPGHDGFNVKHFRHVAFLWVVILFGSALGAAAELIDLLIDFGTFQS